MINRWYLSFADDNDFLGACVVEADTHEEALALTHRLKINPGGQVMIMPVPEDARDSLPLNRLMDKAELKKYGPITRLGDAKKPPQSIGLN